MNENTVKADNIIKTNWLNILIIPEFFHKLDLNTLKEVSLISKLIRLKLKFRLFGDIQFDGNKFDIYFDNNKNYLLKGYFEHLRSYLCYDKDVNEFDYSAYKDLKIEDSLQELKDQLSSVKPFVKSFDITDVGISGYYLLQLAGLFENLKTLRLTACTVSLSEFSQLSKFLTKLDNLEMAYTVFTSLPTDDPSIEYIKFPKTLKDLTIFECKTCTSILLTNPYEFLFHKSTYVNFNEIILPPLNIPTLLNFSFLITFLNSNSSNQFLEANPQLEYLNFDSSSLDQVKIDIFQNSKTLRKLEIVSESENEIINDITVPTLSSIEELQFQNTNQEFLVSIKKLSLSSPNLKELTFILSATEDLADILNNLVTNIIPKCLKLKELNLCIIGELTESLDLRELNNIEVLTVQSQLDTILNINFKNSKSLKNINFYFHRLESLNSNIRESFTNIKDWIFEFTLWSIEGSKVNY